jgi:hypothetical protein
MPAGRKGRGAKHFATRKGACPIFLWKSRCPRHIALDNRGGRCGSTVKRVDFQASGIISAEYRTMKIPGGQRRPPDRPFDDGHDYSSSPMPPFINVTPMYFLASAAANPTALDKLKQIPPAFWLKIGVAVLLIILVVVMLRKLAGANKVVLAVVVLLFVSIVGFNWIYERNEPAWATPAVEKLSNFFPAKDSYNAKQKKPLKP